MAFTKICSPFLRQTIPPTAISVGLCQPLVLLARHAQLVNLLGMCAHTLMHTLPPFQQKQGTKRNKRNTLPLPDLSVPGSALLKLWTL